MSLYYVIHPLNKEKYYFLLSFQRINYEESFKDFIIFFKHSLSFVQVDGIMLFMWIYSVWHDTSIPFKEVIQQFEAWLTQHRLWTKEMGGCLDQAAFVTW